MVPDSNNDLVYGEIDVDLVFMSEQEAREQAQLWHAIYNAKTWGEFRTSIAPRYRHWTWVGEVVQASSAVT